MQSTIRGGGCSRRLFGKLFGMAAALGGAFTCACAAQEPPLVSGNYAIAQKFLHGDAHVILLGDSIQNGLIGFYPKHWQVDKWTGQVVGPNLNVASAGNTGAYGVGFNSPPPPFVNSAFLHLPDQPPAGLAGFAPGAMQHVTFNGAQAPDGGLLANRFTEFGLAPGQDQIYFPGKWADRQDGRINVDVLLYGNPQGLASGAQFDARTNSDTSAQLSIPLNGQAGESGLVKFSGSFLAHPWNPGRGLQGQFRILPGVTPQAGSNISILGLRIHTGEPGFQFANIAWGSKGIDYYINPAHTSEKNLKDYLDATDSNMAMIWLGQNDFGLYSPSAWKAKMQELIARYKSARPGMEFVLVSTYDTDTNDADGNAPGEYAKVLHEIAQSDPDVLFLNLFRAAGEFEFLNANYLSDTVHPNLAGLDYFAGKTQELLALADAQVPEPGSLLLGLGIVCVLCRRGR